MELATMEPVTTQRSAGDEFAYTEFGVDWREPLPRERFGNARFMWGCVAFAVAFMCWMGKSK